MTNDHLDNETSVSAELSETGIKAAAKSRAVASFDRLLGSAADVGSAWFEGIATRKRAKAEGERQLIEATVKHGLDRMKLDDEFAKRAFENNFKKIAQQQLNKDAVVTEAIDDLRRNPPSIEEANIGPAQISEEFMGRFETYAEGATTEHLRERWGRILASEIRKPGTFNPKVLRATDELDAKTAALFEGLMQYRAANTLVKCLMPKLGFTETTALVTAGLLVEPGIGQHRRYVQADDGGKSIWVAAVGNRCVSMPFDAQLDSGDVIGRNEGQPSMAVYVLTDVGVALSSILPSFESLVAERYALKLRSVAPAHVDLGFWISVAPNQIAKIPFPTTRRSD